MEPFNDWANDRRILRATTAIGLALMLLGAACSKASTKPRPRLSLLAPVALTATTDFLRVTLTWSEPSGGAPVARYDVYRDGSLLSSVTPSTTTYVDQTAVPGRTYTYGVDAFGQGAQSSRVSTVVKTPVPLLSSARVQGTFNVSAKTVSQFGFGNHINGGTLGWSLTPKCDNGACDVALADLNIKELRATLHRKGGAYAGSATAKMGDTCGNTKVASALTIEIHVAKADAIDGAWRAVKLAGTLTQQDAAGLGCPSSGITYAITVTLVT